MAIIEGNGYEKLINCYSLTKDTINGMHPLLDLTLSIASCMQQCLEGKQLTCIVFSESHQCMYVSIQCMESLFVSIRGVHAIITTADQDMIQRYLVKVPGHLGVPNCYICITCIICSIVKYQQTKRN